MPKQINEGYGTFTTVYDTPQKRSDAGSRRSGDEGRRDNGTNRYNMNDEMNEVQGQSALISGDNCWGFPKGDGNEATGFQDVVDSGTATETEKGKEDGGY